MLKNFTVVELLRTRSDSVVTIKKNTLRFNMPTAVELHYTPFIQILINAKDKQLAIRECKSTDVQAVKFSKPKGEQRYQLSVTCASVTDMIRKLMQWDEEQAFNVPGVYMADEKALVYDLKSAYEPNKKGGWTSRRNNKSALDSRTDNAATSDDEEVESLSETEPVIPEKSGESYGSYREYYNNPYNKG